MPRSVRLLLALLSAGAILLGGHAASRAQGTPNPADLLLQAEDAGKNAVLAKTSEGSDERGSWARERWERDRETLDVRSGPIVIDEMVFVARDLGAAGNVFAEESGRQSDFPEATDRRTGSYPFPVGRAGDEIIALSACDDCLGKDTINLHHRVVVRKGVVVIALYLYGRDSVVTQELASWFVGQALGHVPDGIVAQVAPAPQSGGGDPPQAEGAPPPDGSPASTAATAAVVQARPQDLAVKKSGAGKEAAQKEEHDGSDDRGTWYEVRYERPHTYAGYRSGPVTIYNRVFVARSEQAARGAGRAIRTQPEVPRGV